MIQCLKNQLHLKQDVIIWISKGLILMSLKISIILKEKGIQKLTIFTKIKIWMFFKIIFLQNNIKIWILKMIVLIYKANQWMKKKLMLYKILKLKNSLSFLIKKKIKTKEKMIIKV